MSQHTPGPWTHDATDIRDADGRTVAWVGWGRGHISMKITLNEQVANARLIAAAPAMREALRELAEDTCTYAAKMPGEFARRVANARAILAAIEGA